MALSAALFAILSILGDIQPCAAQIISPFSLVTGPRVLATWQKNTVTGHMATSVWEIGDRGKRLHAHSCGSKLSALDLGLDLEFETDDHGEGTLLVGGTPHEIGLYPEHSGGISCRENYSNTHVVTECVIPLDSHLARRDGPRPRGGSVAGCFGNGPGNHFFRAVSYPEENPERDLPRFERRIESKEGKEEDAAAGAIEGKRTDGGRFKRYMVYKKMGRNIVITRKIGSGSPQRWIRHKTLTHTQMCHGDGTGVSCSTGQSKSHTVTHTATFAGAINFGKKGWISAGYNVAWAKTTAEDHSCTSSGKNQTICLKSWHGHQAYRVESKYEYRATPWRGPYYIRSPMDSDRHSTFYCGINDCQGKGVSTWMLDGYGEWDGVEQLPLNAGENIGMGSKDMKEDIEKEALSI